jgi:hypothetical protein
MRDALFSIKPRELNDCLAVRDVKILTAMGRDAPPDSAVPRSHYP